MKSRATTLTIIFILLVMIGGIIFIILLPKWRQIKILTAEIAAIEQQATILENKQIELTRLLSDKTVWQNLTDQLELLFPKVEGVNQIVLILDQFSQFNLMSPSVISIVPPIGAQAKGGPVPPVGTQSTQFSLELIGNFPDLVTALDQIETAERFIDLRDVSISLEGESSLRVQVSGLAYSKPSVLSTADQLADSNFVATLKNRLAKLNLDRAVLEPITLSPDFGRPDPFAPTD